jgi:outer membrane protein assembly factor BamB
LAVTAIALLLVTNAIAWLIIFIGNTTTTTIDTTRSPPTEEPAPEPEPSTTTIQIVYPGDQGVYGRHDYRGNNSLTGETSGGFRTVLGSYWEPVQPGGFFGADPIAYGRFLYVVSATHDAVYAIDQTNGSIRFTLQTNGRMQTAPAVGQFTYDIANEATETATRLVAVSEDGTIYSRNAGAGSSEHWQMRLEEDVSAAPLIADDQIIVATESGSVIAVGWDAEIIWRYPVPNTYSSPFMQTPAIANGNIYAPDDHGRLHVISLATGEAKCTPTALGMHPSGHPLVADDQVVIPADGSILVLPADGCNNAPRLGCNNAPRLIIDQVDSPLSPAYADSTIFSVENSYILAWDLETLSDTVWDHPFDAEDRITTAPTVADGVLYFGTQGGVVHAVDAETGLSLWQFEVGKPIFGGPVVATNGIFVITADEVISIAGE